MNNLIERTIDVLEEKKSDINKTIYCLLRAKYIGISSYEKDYTLPLNFNKDDVRSTLPPTM